MHNLLCESPTHNKEARTFTVKDKMMDSLSLNKALLPLFKKKSLEQVKDPSY